MAKSLLVGKLSTIIPAEIKRVSGRTLGGDSKVNREKQSESTQGLKNVQGGGKWLKKKRGWNSLKKKGEKETVQGTMKKRGCGSFKRGRGKPGAGTVTK